jgi:beta-lactamase class A
MLVAAALVVTLADRLAAIAGTSGGRLGVCAQAVEGGAPQQLNGSERFPMQSVYKLPIAMAVLDEIDRADRKAVTLDARIALSAEDMADVHFHSPLHDRYPNGGIDVSVRDLIRDAIVDSDGVASDVLYRLAGGGARVTAYVRGIGVTGMAIAATEREMAKDEQVQYRNYATPCAAVALLGALQAGRGLSPASRELLLRDLADSVPGPNRIKGQLPPGTPVAHKTGTAGTHGGLTRATNDIGLVTLPGGRHLAVAVFVKDSTADEAARERAIAGAARAAYDAWMVK